MIFANFFLQFGVSYGSIATVDRCFPVEELQVFHDFLNFTYHWRSEQKIHFFDVWGTRVALKKRVMYLFVKQDR